MNIKNRIVGHRRIRAGDLVPHELNWREHPPSQRAALEALLDEIGFARSLLAYELPDGRLKLIDGHLRREVDPEQVVEVEIVNLNDDEARKLLLSLDSVAGLATANAEAVTALRKLTTTDTPALAALWDSLADAVAATETTLREATAEPVEQYLVLITCRDEAHQIELLERFQAEGLSSKALMS